LLRCPVRAGLGDRGAHRAVRGRPDVRGQPHVAGEGFHAAAYRHRLSGRRRAVGLAPGDRRAVLSALPGGQPPSRARVSMLAAAASLERAPPEVTLMIMKLLRLALVPASAVLVSACTTLSVKSDVNHELIGSVQCHSFAWAGAFHGNSPLRNTIASPLNENR